MTNDLMIPADDLTITLLAVGLVWALLKVRSLKKRIKALENEAQR